NHLFSWREPAGDADPVSLSRVGQERNPAGFIEIVRKPDKDHLDAPGTLHRAPGNHHGLPLLSEEKRAREHVGLKEPIRVLKRRSGPYGTGLSVHLGGDIADGPDKFPLWKAIYGHGDLLPRKHPG